MVRYKFVHFNKRSDFDSYVPNPESNSANGNEYYNYVVFIKDTKEIYTHGQFYNCSDSGDAPIDEIIEELRNSINSKADLSSLETLIKEVEENEEVTAAALTELHENKADKSEIPDVSTFATKDELNTLSVEVDNKVDSTTFTTLSETVAGHTTSIDNLSNNKADKTDLDDYAKQNDLNTKQDLLVSGTNIKTVNGNSILGSGNIETPDTKVTSADNHYGYNPNNSTSTTGAFVTKITKDAANHVTSFESRALTATDIPSLDASKITSGTISIERLPAGALERMFVVASETAAMSATVQEGDVVQVTGNNNKMYFCISNTATTFSTKFKEFTAGTATSVPWSGITGKPTGIDGWGDRIGVIESGYATQSWVGENFLSKSGGQIVGEFAIKASATNSATIHFRPDDGAINHWLGVNKSGKLWFSNNGWSQQWDILHSGNYSDYALSTNGGTVNGSITATSFIGNLTGNADSATNADTLDGKHATDLVETIILNKDSNSLDLNSRKSVHTWLSTGWAYGDSDKALNQPWTSSAANVWTLPGLYPLQLAIFYNSNDIRVRGNGGSSTWADWMILVHSGNIHYFNAGSANKLATPRTIWGQSFDGTNDITGALTAPSFIGNLTGNADSANVLAQTYNENINYGAGSKVNLIRYTSNWESDGFPVNYTAGLSVMTNYVGWQLVSYGGHNENPYFRSLQDNGTWKAWRQLAFLTDNVASATKLQTPRTIWGQSFDGEANVAGRMSDVSSIFSNIPQDGSYNIFRIVPYDGALLFQVASGDGKSKNGRLAVTGYESTALTRLYFYSNLTMFDGGNVAIGGTMADEKLHIHGNVKASGSMYAVDFETTSDNRLKDFVSDINVDFESIKQIPKKYYYWKDKSMGEDLQLGTSAQELAKVYPECVHYDETNDRYSVNYQKLSIVALAAIDKLYDRILELEYKLYD